MASHRDGKKIKRRRRGKKMREEEEKCTKVGVSDTQIVSYETAMLSRIAEPAWL